MYTYPAVAALPVGARNLPRASRSILLSMTDQLKQQAMEASKAKYELVMGSSRFITLVKVGPCDVVKMGLDISVDEALSSIYWELTKLGYPNFKGISGTCCSSQAFEYKKGLKHSTSCKRSEVLSSASSKLVNGNRYGPHLFLGRS